MTADDCLDKILERMVPTHNIQRGYTADGRNYTAYAAERSGTENRSEQHEHEEHRIFEIPQDSVKPARNPELRCRDAVQQILYQTEFSIC